MRKTTSEYLEILQSVHGRPEINHSVKTLVDTAWESWSQQGASRGSPSEQSIFDSYAVFDGYFRALIAANKLSVNAPIMAHIQNNSFNACAYTTCDGDHIVLYDTQLNAMIQEFVMVATITAFGNYDSQQVTMRFEHCYQLLNEFRHRERSNNASQLADNFLKIVGDNHRLATIGSMCGVAVTTFIMAHEVAHHVLGHTDGAVRQVPYITHKLTVVDVDVNTTDHDNELDADRLGYKLFHSCLDPELEQKDLVLHAEFYHVPLFFFDILELVDYGADVDYDIVTHPNPSLRKKRLIDEFVIGGQYGDIYNGLREFRDKFGQWMTVRSS